MTSNSTTENSKPLPESSTLGDLISKIKKMQSEIDNKIPLLSDRKGRGSSVDSSAPSGDSHETDAAAGAKPERKQEIAAQPEEGSSFSRKSQLDKLNNNLDQIVSSLSRLRKFEKYFHTKISSSEDDVRKLLEHVHVHNAEAKEVDSAEAKKIKIVDEKLEKLNKVIRKLKHQIPSSSATEKSKKSGGPDENVGTPEDAVVDDLLTLELSESFCNSELYDEIKATYNGLGKNEKTCLLCFSVLGENEELKRRMLTYWWAGEDLIAPVGEKTVRDAAVDMLGIFVSKGLIVPVHKKRLREPKRFRMPPVVRSAIVKIAEEADLFSYNEDGNFMATFSGGNKAAFQTSKVVEAKIAVEEKRKAVEEERKAAEEARKAAGDKSLKIEAEKAAEKARKLAVEASKAEADKRRKMEAMKAAEEAMKVAEEAMKAADKSRKSEGSSSAGDSVRPNWLKYWSVEEKPKTIFNVNTKFPDLELKKLAKHLEIEADEWLSKMKDLRVLYLGTWRASVKHHIEVDSIGFLKGLKNMRGLRLLSLQGISRINQLSESIKGLINLEILDLKSCHNLEVLPKEISFLRNLTHLDISNCFLIDHMPKGLSSLTKLQVLKGFVVGDHRAQKFCTLHCLSRMKGLIKLTVIVSKKDFPSDSELEELKALEALQKLTLSWGANSTIEEKKEKADERQLLPKNLEKLDIQCYPGRVRPVWLSPDKLAKLKKLYIRGGRLGEDPGLLIEGQKWKGVETLRLKYLAGIKMSWEEIQDWFPDLSYLEKVDCPLISLCPCDDEGVWVSNVMNQ